MPIRLSLRGSPSQGTCTGDTSLRCVLGALAVGGTATTAQGALTGPGGGTPGTGPSAGRSGALKFKVKLVKRVRRNASRMRLRVTIDRRAKVAFTFGGAQLGTLARRAKTFRKGSATVTLVISRRGRQLLRLLKRGTTLTVRAKATAGGNTGTATLRLVIDKRRGLAAA